MAKSVGVRGDSTAEGSTSHTITSYKGTWTPSGPSEKSYPKLTVGGVEVIHEVSWTFAFAGTDSASSDAPVTDSSTVTVSSSSTILQSGSNKVLLDGDSNQDAHGNKVTINAGGKLTSG